MTDEFALRRAITDATRAHAALENEALKSAFDALERDYLAYWRLTDVNDTNGRERIFTAINVLAKVRDHLAMTIANGRVAQKELDLLAGRKVPRKAG